MVRQSLSESGISRVLRRNYRVGGTTEFLSTFLERICAPGLTGVGIEIRVASSVIGWRNEFIIGARSGSPVLGSIVDVVSVGWRSGDCLVWSHPKVCASDLKACSVLFLKRAASIFCRFGFNCVDFAFGTHGVLASIIACELGELSLRI